MIDIDNKKSKIHTFCDDVGTNLILKDESGKPKPGQGFGFFFENDSGTGAAIDIDAEGLPAKQASSLEVKGELIVLTASEQSSHKRERVKLEKGQVIKTGKIECEVVRVMVGEEIDHGGMEIRLKFINQKLPLAGVDFYDLAGEPLKSYPGTASKERIDGVPIVEWHDFTLVDHVDSVTVVFRVWEGLKWVEVPIDLKVGIGL